MVVVMVVVHPERGVQFAVWSATRASQGRGGVMEG